MTQAMQTLTATRNTPSKQTASAMAGLASSAHFLFEEHAGLFYNFVQQYKQALLVIQDDSVALPQMAGSGSLAYKPVTGQVEDAEAVKNGDGSQLFLMK
jgi:hypothetical protein